MPRRVRGGSSHAGFERRRPPTAIDSTVIFIANFAAPATMLVVLSLGLNLQWGHAGLFNAGVAAFVGVGAYTFGMLATGVVVADPTYGYPGHWGLSGPTDLIVAALVAMLVSGLLGILIAISTIRLRADYLAIATLALAEIIRYGFKNARSITGGDLALSSVPRPFALYAAQGWRSDGVFTLVAAAVLLLVLVMIGYLVRSPWGRAVRAVREDEEAAEALGKNTTVLRLGAFGIGCALMGLYGALQASWLYVILPDTFLPFATFTAYVVVILGGSGNPRGVVAGGYLFYALGWGEQEIKSLVRLPDWLNARLDYLLLIGIGLILIGFILFRPQGLLPERKYVPKVREPA
ncbi:MAG: branched-chain amino acid ABC transporter permease [Nitrospirae bacterium]|nr:MAG: branched-chain amino acid ABC transporter permease [Nitrospirota bacterium]